MNKVVAIIAFVVATVLAAIIALGFGTLWILIFAYKVPYAYSWTSIIAVCVAIFIAGAILFGSAYLNLRAGQSITMIGILLQIGVLALCFTPGAILLCYGYPGLNYYNNIRIANNIGVAETGKYQSLGYQYYMWNDSKIYTNYYGYTWSTDTESFTYNFVTLIAPLQLSSYNSSAVKPVFAVNTITKKTVQLLIDQDYVGTYAFPNFKSEGDSDTVSCTYNKHSNYIFLALDKLVYKGALAEARRKFPELNIPEDYSNVVFVRLGYSPDKNLWIFSIYHVIGWIFTAAALVCFPVATIVGLVGCVLSRGDADGEPEIKI